jgi:hypothetical protein
MAVGWPSRRRKRLAKGDLDRQADVESMSLLDVQTAAIGTCETDVTAKGFDRHMSRRHPQDQMLPGDADVAENKVRVGRAADAVNGFFQGKRYTLVQAVENLQHRATWSTGLVARHGAGHGIKGNKRCHVWIATV